MKTYLTQPPGKKTASPSGPPGRHGQGFTFRMILSLLLIVGSVGMMVSFEYLESSQRAKAKEAPTEVTVVDTMDAIDCLGEGNQDNVYDLKGNQIDCGILHANCNKKNTPGTVCKYNDGTIDFNCSLVDKGTTWNTCCCANAEKCIEIIQCEGYKSLCSERNQFQATVNRFCSTPEPSTEPTSEPQTAPVDTPPPPQGEESNENPTPDPSQPTPEWCPRIYIGFRDPAQNQRHCTCEKDELFYKAYSYPRDPNIEPDVLCSQKLAALNPTASPEPTAIPATPTPQPISGFVREEPPKSENGKQYTPCWQGENNNNIECIFVNECDGKEVWVGEDYEDYKYDNLSTCVSTLNNLWTACFENDSSRVCTLRSACNSTRAGWFLSEDSCQEQYPSLPPIRFSFLPFPIAHALDFLIRGIEHATVTFTKAGAESITTRTDYTGKFFVTLPGPGYSVTIEKAGFQPITASLPAKNYEKLEGNFSLCTEGQDGCPADQTDRILARRGGQLFTLSGTQVTPQPTPNYALVETAFGTYDIRNGGVEQYLNDLLTWLFGIAGGIAIISIIIAGYGYVTSGGNAEARNTARRRLISTIVALVFIFSGALLLVFTQGMF